MKRLLKASAIPYLLSFLIPLFVMAVSFAAHQIYPGGPRTVLAGDAYHQYVNFHALYRNIMHNGGGWFYTFTSGLGLNLYAFSTYYLGSFLMPLTYFFNAANMPDALYWITLIKFGLIGLSSYTAFRHLYPKIKTALVVAFSVAYSLMSFVTSQSEIIMWLDVFIWVPLIIWGLHRLMDNGRHLLYFATLTVLFIQNYYFGFMMAIFLTLYFLGHYALEPGHFWRKLRDFAVTSILAGVTSLVTILPMYLDLKANGETFTPIDQLKTDSSWYLDVFAKNFVGSYDTTQYGAVPMIYIGLLPLALAILFFSNAQVRLQAKLTFGAIVAVFIASFYLEPLDLFWQGMHTPNMFLHRYAWLFSLLVVLLAMESLSRFDGIATWQSVVVLLVLAAAFVATLYTKQYTYLSVTLLILTLAFLAAYLLGVTTYKQMPQVIMVVASFAVFEAGINAYEMVHGISEEWHYSSRESYEAEATRISDAAALVTKNSSKHLWRTDSPDPDTANDGMKFGFNTISQFSSVRNRKASSTLNLLGFRSEGTNLNLRYPDNTLLMDGLLAVKYNFNRYEPAKYAFKASHVNTEVSENALALPVGFVVADGFSDVKLGDKPTDILKNQTHFLNELSGSDTTYFKQFYTTDEKVSGDITGFGDRITLSKGKNDPELSMTYTLAVPAGSQAYLKLSNVSYGDQDHESMTLKTPTNTYISNTDDTGYFFNLGYYEKATSVPVTVSFPDNDRVTFDVTQFWALDVAAYRKSIEKIEANPTSVTARKNGLVIKAETAHEHSDLFLTLPYDKGWSATVDGKAVKIEQAQTGFMKVALPKGESEVVLTFVPQGFRAGLMAFVSGIVLMIGYVLVLERRKR
jgi:uncharacterized membrane protein YfhO